MKSISQVLRSVAVSPNPVLMKQMQQMTRTFVTNLQADVRKKRLDAQVFVGGSFAKETVLSGNAYDIDIFVRFPAKKEDVSSVLEPIVRRAAAKQKFSVSVVHGSRDYFRVHASEHVLFEIVPVLKIKHIRDATNVTDCSYFHVAYMKKRLTSTMKQQVLYAKLFCKAQGVYGAESYIQGFSGYGLECLILQYTTFERMLRALVAVKPGEKLILDSANHYRSKKEILLALNESKTHGPIILVDPTWKERNVVAALSTDSFKKFQDAARAFLRHPSEQFFVKKELSEEAMRQEARTKKAEFLHVEFMTDRQAGDIAGTKLRKFHEFFVAQMEKYFDVLENEFVYSGDQNGETYIIARAKKELIQQGPPASMEEHANAFRKEHPNAIVKKGVLEAKIPIKFDLGEYAKIFLKNNERVMQGMGVRDWELI